MMLPLLWMAVAWAAPWVAPSPASPGPHAAQVVELGAGDAGVFVGPRAPRIHVPARVRTGSRVLAWEVWWRRPRHLPWSAITDLVLFAAEVEHDGRIVETEHWGEAARRANEGRFFGVDVHLAVRQFDPTALESLLRSAEHRARFVQQLRYWVVGTGAAGVVVDLEGVPRRRRAQLVALARELAEADLGEIVFAIPAVDHAGAWDLAAIAEHATLYLMAYDYHWNGSSFAGPVDPVQAGEGTVWRGVNRYSVARSVGAVLTAGVPSERVLLGIALYGRRWPVAGSALPTRTTGRGRALTFDEARPPAGVARQVEASSQSLWYQAGGHQTWAGDAETLRARVGLARRHQLGGVGFWALGYAEQGEVWSALRE